MRRLATADRVRSFLSALGREARGPVRAYLTGLEDVRAMRRLQLVDDSGIRTAMTAIEPELYRFPNIDAPSFQRAVEELLTGEGR